MDDEPRDVTGLLAAWAGGDDDALSQLMPHVLAELKTLARKHLHGQAPGHTLPPTALVNEVYLRLVGAKPQPFHGREEFFNFASALIRRILIDHARSKLAQKRGAGAAALPLAAVSGVSLPEAVSPDDLLALSQGLSRLEALSPRQARIVEYRHLLGLTKAETATVLGVGERTVDRDYRAARQFLLAVLRQAEG